MLWLWIHHILLCILSHQYFGCNFMLFCHILKEVLQDMFELYSSTNAQQILTFVTLFFSMFHFEN